jgi:hypothetical protein
MVWRDQKDSPNLSVKIYHLIFVAKVAILLLKNYFSSGDAPSTISIKSLVNS